MDRIGSTVCGGRCTCPKVLFDVPARGFQKWANSASQWTRDWIDDPLRLTLSITSSTASSLPFLPSVSPSLLLQVLASPASVISFAQRFLIVFAEASVKNARATATRGMTVGSSLVFGVLLDFDCCLPGSFGSCPIKSDPNARAATCLTAPHTAATSHIL